MSKRWTRKAVEDRLNKLRTLLKVRFQNCPIKTFSLIGSSALPDYKASLWSNDVDTSIIADPVTPQLLEEIERISAEICDELTDDNFDVEFVIRSGPMKLAKDPNKSHILLHHAVYTSDEYRKESVLLKYSWKHSETVLVGKSLVETSDVNGLTLDDVIYAHSGLKNCIEMLEKKITRYKGWDRNGDSVIPVLKEMPVAGVDLLEIAFYSVLNTTMNIMRAIKRQLFHHSENLWKDFPSNFPAKNATLPLEFFNLKRKIREGTQTVNQQLIDEVVASSLNFLRECETVIKNKSYEKTPAH